MGLEWLATSAIKLSLARQRLLTWSVEEQQVAHPLHAKAHALDHVAVL